MKKKTKIMELKLVRFAKKKGYTIGRLYCLGERDEEGTCDGIAGNGSQTGDLEADEGLKGDGGAAAFLRYAGTAATQPAEWGEMG